MQSIYFDNAATSKLSQEAYNVMFDFLMNHYGNPSSPHSFGDKPKEIIKRSREIVSRSINASISEIIFTGGGTESNNMIIKRAIKDLGVTRIISSEIEHHCVLNTTLKVKEEYEIEVTYVKLDKAGRVNYEHLENLLKEGSKKTLVSLMHSNNEIGTILDLEKVGSLCEKYQAYFHSDTVQTIGSYPIDVQRMKIHFLSGSAHKFHGPKGVGFAFVSNNNKIKSLIDGGKQEYNKRAGTENVAGIASLGVALELAVKDMEKNRNYISKLKKHLIDEITYLIPGIEFNGDTTDEGSHYKLVSLSFPVLPQYLDLISKLNKEGIACSGHSACSDSSHVLEALKTDPQRNAVRVSFSKQNQESEIDALIKVLLKITNENLSNPQAVEI